MRNQSENTRPVILNWAHNFECLPVISSKSPTRARTNLLHKYPTIFVNIEYLCFPSPWFSNRIWSRSLLASSFVTSKIKSTRLRAILAVVISEETVSPHVRGKFCSTRVLSMVGGFVGCFRTEIPIWEHGVCLWDQGWAAYLVGSLLKKDYTESCLCQGNLLRSHTRASFQINPSYLPYWKRVRVLFSLTFLVYLAWLRKSLLVLVMLRCACNIIPGIPLKRELWSVKVQ